MLCICWNPVPGYRSRTARQLFRAKKLPENAFLTLPAAGQSAPTKLFATPMPVQVFLRVRTYPTHKLFIGRLEQSSETLISLPKGANKSLYQRRVLKKRQARRYVVGLGLALRARAGGCRKFFQVTPKASPLEMPMRRHSEGAGFWLLLTSQK